ncbi:MAG: PAS domain-containing sensor histidine kinase [Gemmatimonadota bacterium]
MPSRVPTDQQGENGNTGGDPSVNGLPSAERFGLLRTAIDRAAAAVELAQQLGRQRAGLVMAVPRSHRPLAERLALHDARFRALVSVTGHVVWSMDTTGRMADLQPAWMTFTGQTFAQMHKHDGLGWCNALHPDDREQSVQRLHEALASEHVFEHTARVQHLHDGQKEWRHMLMRAAPVRGPEGSIIEWVGVNTDVTEFVMAQAEAEAAERSARLEAEHARDLAEAAWHTAEDATKAKGRILAAASHDLRTPLAAIGGYTALLKDGLLGSLTTEQAKALERMDVAREHLFTLVGDILDAAHAESGLSRLHLDSVPLGEVCNRLQLLTAGQAEQKRQRFTCHVLPASDAERVLVRADRDRLMQILVNLVTNAIKFTDVDGEVRVDAFQSDDHVAMQVRDTGHGIPRDQMGRIFEPFVQLGRRAGDSTARDAGVGLGLATSMDLARRMGGDITVESAEGVGSTFTLVLPLAEDRARDMPASDA